jgi:uncharacterized protein involved in cysteine biosynthesis
MPALAKLLGYSFGFFAVLALLALFGFVFGALAGLIVGAAFPATFSAFLGAIGMGALAPWQFGGMLGFVGSFFRSSSATEHG